MYPENFMLGLEIRVKVSDYVNDRIQALRAQHSDQYQNVAVLRTNAMKYLPNFFHKGQVRTYSYTIHFIQLYFYIKLVYTHFYMLGLVSALINKFYFSSKKCFFCIQIRISRRLNTNGGLLISGC